MSMFLQNSQYSKTQHLAKRKSFSEIMGYKNEFEELLLSAIMLKQKDESVKTRVKSWNLLKENLEEYCKENNIFMEESNYTYCGSYTPDCKTMIRLRDHSVGLIIKKLFDPRDNTAGKYEIVFDIIFTKLHCHYYYFDFKEWKDILFIVKWYFEPQTDENIELFKAAIEKKKAACAALNLVSEINQKTLKSYFDKLCEKFKLEYPGINYQIENDSSFYIVNFRLRPYYKLQLKIKCSELALQLKEVDEVLEKALEISSSSLCPSIILNRNLANL